MSKIENAVNYMIGIANDNSHGYSQINRWGPDYDCSSLVITSYEQAGVPVKTNGATYTGNMYNVFLACGFKDVTSQVNMASGSGMVRGDVLLNTAYHTAMYIGNGQLCQASGDEYGGIKGANKGDQTGTEIYVTGYYNYPWDCVLRYTVDNTSASATTTSTNHIQVAHQVMSQGVGWNSEVVDYNTVNSDGYSGYMGKAMIAFRACTVGNDDSICGHLKYRAHIKGGNWYDWRQDYEKDNAGDTFAGDGSNAIDGLQMTMVGVNGKKAHYRVHTLNHGWLDWVTEYGNGDNGYAGWYGDAIDAVQVEII